MAEWGGGGGSVDLVGLAGWVDLAGLAAEEQSLRLVCKPPAVIPEEHCWLPRKAL